MGGLVDEASNILFGTEDTQAAIRDAAGIQAEATETGIAETGRQFDVTQASLAPTIEAGDTARQQQLALLGLSGTDAQSAALSNIQESPAQQFLRDRAQRNLLQNQSAIGGLGGGNVRSALVEQGAGFASQDLNNQFSRLQGLSAPGTQTAVAQGQLGSQNAQQISQLTGQGAAATASGILGSQQAASDARSQTIGLGVGGAILLSDKDKKHDISDLDLKECYDTVMSMDLKAWRYLEDIGLGQDLHYGVMYQDAPESIKAEGMKALDLHDELNLIAGALQYMKQEGLCQFH